MNHENVHTLTARELEVIRLLSGGLSNQEIADQLIISERTVRTHVSNCYLKTHCHNRVQLTLYAQQHDIAEPPYESFMELMEIIRAQRKMLDAYEKRLVKIREEIDGTDRNAADREQAGHTTAAPANHAGHSGGATAPRRTARLHLGAAAEDQQGVAGQ